MLIRRLRECCAEYSINHTGIFNAKIYFASYMCIKGTIFMKLHMFDILDFMEFVQVCVIARARRRFSPGSVMQPCQLLQKTCVRYASPGFQLRLVKEPRLSISIVIRILSSDTDTLFVSSTNSIQIVRRQCCLTRYASPGFRLRR